MSLDTHEAAIEAGLVHLSIPPANHAAVMARIGERDRGALAEEARRTDAHIKAGGSEMTGRELALARVELRKMLRGLGVEPDEFVLHEPMTPVDTPAPGFDPRATPMVAVTHADLAAALRAADPNATPLVIAPPAPRVVQTDPNATPPLIVNPARTVPQ